MWGDGYGACNAESQSPIDLATADVTIGAKEARVSLAHSVHYKPLADRTVSNNGHNVQVDGDFGMLKLPDGPYMVKQFHFHFPSEHTVNGQHTAGEIHIVHQQAGATGTNSLAVISILLQEPETLADFEATQEARNREISFLAALGFDGSLPRNGAVDLNGVGYSDEIPAEGEVDLNAFAKELSGDFYHYFGSLTTPPCSQTVHWYVMEQAAAVTPEMVQTFKALFPSPSNNRPIQPLNGRAIVFSEFAAHGEFEKASVVESEQAFENAKEAVNNTKDEMKEAKVNKTLAKAEAVSQEAKAEMAQADVENAKGKKAVAVAEGDKKAAKEAAEDIEAAEDKVKNGKDKLAEVKAARAEAKEEFDEAAAAHEEAQDEQAAAEDSLDEAQSEEANVADDAEDAVDADDDEDDPSETAASDSSVAMHARAGSREGGKEGEEGLSGLAGFAERTLVEEATKPSRDTGGGRAVEAAHVSAGDARREPSQVEQTGLASEHAKLDAAKAGGWAGAKRLGFSPSSSSQAEAHLSIAKTAAEPDEVTKAEAKKLIAEVERLTADNATSRLVADAREATAGAADESEGETSALNAVVDADESNAGAAEDDMSEDADDNADAHDEEADVDGQKAGAQSDEEGDVGAEAESAPEPAQEGSSRLAESATHAFESDAAGTPSQATVEAELNSEADKLGLIDDSSA